MRILVLTSTFPRWTGDREPPFVFELCRRLAETHEVLVLAPHCAGAATSEQLGNLSVRRFRYAPEALESLAYEGGIPAKLRHSRWRYLLVPPFLLAEGWAAWRAVRELRPEAIHAHWILPQGLVGLVVRLAARGGRPALVSTSHGTDLQGLGGRFASWLKRRVLRDATAVTVVSAAMKAEAIRLGAAPDRVRVMPMGVDARQRFLPGTGERSTDEILFVGRLVPKKGLAQLLEAFASARSAVPGIRLTIVGSGPLDAELRSRTRSLGIEGCVTFTGSLQNQELGTYYRRAALLAFPSDQEGFGLVVAEALACECPVVASDLPAVGDLVQDGITGLLARPGSAADLAEQMLLFLRDPVFASRLARAGRARVLERFDWESVGRGYEELLRAAARPADEPSPPLRS